MASRGCGCCHLLRIGLSRLPRTSFESHWATTHHGSTGVLFSWDIMNTTREWGSREEWTHILCVSFLLMCMLLCPIELYSQNTSLKIQLLRISRWRQQSIKPSVGPLLTRGLGKLHRLMAHEASPADLDVKPELLKGLEMMRELFEADTNTWRMAEPRSGRSWFLMTLLIMVFIPLKLGSILII